MGVRILRQMGSADSWNNGWKIRKRKRAKNSFLRLCYILRAIRASRCRERRYADHMFIQIYTVFQNAQFRSQIFFASDGKGALTPLTKNCGRFWYNQLYVTLNCVAVTAREVYVTTRCPSVCLSVRLSVPAIDRCCIVRRVCCWAPGEQEISIDCCTAGAQLQSQAVPPRQPT